MEISHLLEHHGIKPTPNRVLVARAMSEAGRPVSMMELEETIDSVDKSGISRALAIFRERHLVHVIEDGGESVRYELCHSHEGSDDDLHVHFFCERCHKTFCLEDTPVPAVDVPPGYRPRTVNYIIKGICPACADRA